MKLHKIDARYFNDYSSAEPDSSIYQTSFWADYMVLKGYKASFYEAIDDIGTCVGLALVLSKKESFLSSKLSAYIPYGYLVNYYDPDFLKQFHKLLIEELRNEKIAKLSIEPPIGKNMQFVSRFLTDLGYHLNQEKNLYEVNVEDHVDGLNDRNLIWKISCTSDDSIFRKLSSGKKDEEKLELFKCLDGHGLCYAAMLDCEKSLRAINESIAENEAFISEHRNDYKMVEQLAEKENEIKRLKKLASLIGRYEEDPYIEALCVSYFSDKCTILFKMSADPDDNFSAEKQIIDQICTDCKKRGIINVGSEFEFAYSRPVEYLGNFTLKI